MIPETSDHVVQSRIWVLRRIIPVFLVLLFVGLALYIIAQEMDFLLVSYSILFALPFSVGGAATFLANLSDDVSESVFVWLPVVIVLAVLLIGGLLLGEGIICIIMIAPLWLLSAVAGSFWVQNLFRRSREKVVLRSSMLLALPFAMLPFEGEHSLHSDVYQVERSVEINASPAEIWPHLLRMADISPEEGQWNFSQDVLGIPRPASAIVKEQGENAVRHAIWGNRINFEEHISDWSDQRELEWRFVFPNDSVHKYTDEHISPDGHYLAIQKGGYELIPVQSGGTRLTLKTSYRANTPVNTYSAWWGEIILGDIQSNILKIVKDRAENQPDAG